VGLDRLARDAVELVERRLQLAGGDLLVVIGQAPCLSSLHLKGASNGAEHILPAEIRTEGDANAVRASPAPVRLHRTGADESTSRPCASTTGSIHQAYVDNLNKALDGSEWDGRPLEQVLAMLDEIPEDKRAAVRNNGGGHANHSLFWQVMKPGGGGDPSGVLADAIGDTFGDPDHAQGGAE